MICTWCYRETSTDDRCSHCDRAPLLQGCWVLETSLGHGASGQTWRARHVENDRRVAIKELSFRRVADIKQVELFQREAELLRDLDHPGIPGYEDHFVVEEDRHVSMYLVQELIDGEALDTGKRTDESEVVEMLRQVLDILTYLAERRPPVVHRDIKPSNIMRREDGGIVLIDFGSTKAAIGATIGETTAGTLGYMAPEQLRGQATPASDSYSLAATAVALLGGADVTRFLDPHDPGSWRDELTVSPHLGDLLEEMLEVDVAWRLTDHDELRERLVDLEQRVQALVPATRATPPRALAVRKRDNAQTALQVQGSKRSLAVEVAQDPGQFALLAAPLGVATGFMFAYAVSMVAQFLPAATLAALPAPQLWWVPAWFGLVYLAYFALLLRGRAALARQEA